MPRWTVYGEATVRVYVDAEVEADTKEEAKELAQGILYDAVYDEIAFGDCDIDNVEVIGLDLMDGDEEESVDDDRRCRLA